MAIQNLNHVEVEAVSGGAAINLSGLLAGVPLVGPILGSVLGLAGGIVNTLVGTVSAVPLVGPILGTVLGLVGGIVSL